MKLRIDFVAGIFFYQAFESVLIDIGIIQLVDIVILGIAKLYDRIFQSDRTLLVGVGNRGTVTAVNLGVDQIFLYINVLFNVLNGLLFVFLSKLISLDQRALKSGVGIWILCKCLGSGYLTAAGLIFEELFLGAAVNDLVALALCKRGVGRIIESFWSAL